MACFRNGWKQKVIFLDHMAAATSMSWEMLLVELPSVLLHGGKSWYFLSFSLPSHAQALSWAHRAASSLWGSGLSLVIRSMGNSARLQSSTFHMARPRKHHSSAGYIPRLLITADKRHLSTQQQWPSHKEGLCSVPSSHCQCCGVTMTQLQSHRGDAAAGTAIVKLYKQHQEL